MQFVNYISNIAMPIILFIILMHGMMERKKVFDLFLEGAGESIKILLNIFPTLVRTVCCYKYVKKFWSYRFDSKFFITSFKNDKFS